MLAHSVVGNPTAPLAPPQQDGAAVWTVGGRHPRYFLSYTAFHIACSQHTDRIHSQKAFAWLGNHLHVFDSCFVRADIPCVYRSDLNRKRSEVTRPINIGHDRNDSNIVYGWTSPDLTILSIVAIVEGDGAPDLGVLGRRRKDAEDPGGPGSSGPLGRVG